MQRDRPCWALDSVFRLSAQGWGIQHCGDPFDERVSAGVLVRNKLRFSDPTSQPLSQLPELGPPLCRRKAQQPLCCIEDFVGDRECHARGLPLLHKKDTVTTWRSGLAEPSGGGRLSADTPWNAHIAPLRRGALECWRRLWRSHLTNSCHGGVASYKQILSALVPLHR